VSKIVLITGTDTGVGKTFVSALIVANLKQRGLRVAVCKPVETGCEMDPDLEELVGRDGELLNVLNGNEQEIGEVSPYRFLTPVAPFVAAKLEKVEISTNALEQHILKLSEKVDIVVVEGAGGLLVPITANYTFADLAANCGAQSIVVVGSKLGALNHACLTFEVLRNRNLKFLGYVFNDLFNTANATEPALATNSEALRQLASLYGAEECCHLERCDEVIDIPTINELSLSPQVMALCQKIAPRTN